MPRNDFDDFEDSADFPMNDGEESNPITFGELGVPGPLVRVLAADGKKTAFPIQADTLPDSLAGRDVLGRGRTGSGKTLAFSIPLVTRLGSYDSLGETAMKEFRDEIKRRKKASLEERRSDDFLPHPRGLVLAPTRELANQINDVLMPLAHAFGMNTTTIYGGVKYIHQVRDLKAGADIVVACPGRLEDLLRQKALTLSSVEVVVIDEADEMADMGFLPPVKRLLEQISPDAMVATDVAARGIDVGGVELVVQVEPPADPKSFVHRSGRTARAGKAGDVVTLVLPEQRRETRRLLNQAGIKTKMIEVTHDSPEVLELVGDRAERVDGWSLDKSQPVGNPRKGKNKGAKNMTGDESGRGSKRKHSRNRNRGEQNVAETETRYENVGGESYDDQPQHKHGGKANKKAMKKNRNRAERRAGMSNPEAERRDYLFEHGDERRGNRREDRADTRYEDRRDRRRGKKSDDRYDDRRGDKYSKNGKSDRRDRFDYDRSDEFGSRKHEGSKRIHRKNENRIVRDERSEGAKRHERRMIAKYGNTQGPKRHHSKKNSSPFRSSGTRNGRR